MRRPATSATETRGEHAAAHFDNVDTDVALLEWLGVDMYRFSVWIRLRDERRDVRTGNQHVELTDPISTADGDADMGQVSATPPWRRADVTVSDVL